MKNGERFEGLLAGSTLPAAGAKITLKMTKKLSGDAPSSNSIARREAALVGSSPDHAMTFEVKDLADKLPTEYGGKGGELKTQGAGPLLE